MLKQNRVLLIFLGTALAIAVAILLPDYLEFYGPSLLPKSSHEAQAESAERDDINRTLSIQHEGKDRITMFGIDRETMVIQFRGQGPIPETVAVLTHTG